MSFTAAEAIQVTKNIFGLSGAAKPLPGESDANFHIQIVEGKEFLLKISPDDTEKNLLLLQNAILQQLQTSPRPFQFPTLQPTLQANWIGEFNNTENTANLVRLFNFVPGKMLAEISYHSPALLENLGQQLGYLTQALEHFKHPHAQRELKWDLKQALWISQHLHTLADADEKECVEYFVKKFTAGVLPKLSELRHSVIHNDINDYNILVAQPSLGKEYVSGFIDFGDAIETATICELAIAATYAMLNKPDPLAAAAHVIKGYHTIFPLLENEIAVLFDLICMRLCVSVVNSAIRKKENPTDFYRVVTEKSAWVLLKQLRTIHPRFAHYVFRDACQLEPCPQTSALIGWLQTNSDNIGSLLAPELQHASVAVLDLSPCSLQAEQFDTIVAEMQKKDINVIVGQYDETRLIYSNAQYQSAGNHGNEERTLHIGLDLCLPAGTTIYAPLAGTVHSVADNNFPQDYGPTIILEHHITDDNLTFYTLYGHLSRGSLQKLRVGQAIAKGEILAQLGEKTENGGWSPHLHFQLITDALNQQGNFPGVALASKKSIWLSLCPDPNLITRFPTAIFPAKHLSKADTLTMRHKYIGANVRLSYDEPLEIVRGIGQYLFDATGRKYLDCVNNIAHVGHCHPQVVAAGQQQMAILNTNTRYLHPHLVRYAERLLATLPAPLEVCFFVCSGSEANELALRLARVHTGRKEFLVLDHGYHGNTGELVAISPYKFNGRGGNGKPEYVHVLPLPDSLRDRQPHVIPPVSAQVAAFICESLPSCGGQVVLPENFLRDIYAAVRKNGGVCIADEVQVGLGRVGSHFWGFATQDVVPDIVTMGKPLGNGHPIGVVVTTRAIANSFNNGMEYFNSFGGNPVSCAIGLSVLDVLERENLQAHAFRTGEYLKQQLTALKAKYSAIGDVRGLGLFLGIELVQDQTSLQPTPELATYVVNRMQARGILLSADGPFHNVIKIKPPMVFNQENCDFLTANLDAVLAE